MDYPDIDFFSERNKEGNISGPHPFNVQNDGGFDVTVSPVLYHPYLSIVPYLPISLKYQVIA